MNISTDQFKLKKSPNSENHRKEEQKTITGSGSLKMQCRDGLRREKRNQQQQREREGRERRDVAAAARQTR